MSLSSFLMQRQQYCGISIRLPHIIVLCLPLFGLPNEGLADDEIKVPIRWCALEGSPTAEDPRSVPLPPDYAAATTNTVLWRRHELVTDKVWIPGAGISFRSGLISEISSDASFPIIADPDPPSSGGPGLLGDIFDPRDGVTEWKDAYAACLEEWETRFPEARGIIGLNIREFVKSDGNTSDLLGFAGPGSLESDFDPEEIIEFSGTFGEACMGIGITGHNPTMFITVVDRTFSSGDSDDRLLAHELGHILFLGHGDGLDDDGNGLFDAFCDDIAECPSGDTSCESELDCFPKSVMTSGPCVGDPALIDPTITSLQRDLAREVACHIEGVEGEGCGAGLEGLTNGMVVTTGDVVNDTIGDARHDVDDATVDMISVTMSRNETTKTITVSHLLYDALPPLIVFPNHYFVLIADLDNNSATGGHPNDLPLMGLGGSFQGAELVTLVKFTNPFEFPVISAKVWSWQQGRFVEFDESDGIRQSIKVASGIIDDFSGGQDASSSIPLFGQVQVEIPGTESIVPDFQYANAVAYAARFPLENEEGQTPVIDRAPNGEAPDRIQLVHPTFPQCEAMPGLVTQGGAAAVQVVGLFENANAHVVLGARQVATGMTNENGEANIRFPIPPDTTPGTHLITVAVDGTAMTADCSIDVRPSNCNPGMVLCDGACVSILTDDDNCGACSNRCDDGEVCLDGQCHRDASQLQLQSQLERSETSQPKDIR